jgi:multiple sugar transport system permease protein
MQPWLMTAMNRWLPVRLSPLARRRERWFYLLITPWLIGLVLFQLGPVLGALGLALFEWPLGSPWSAANFAGGKRLRLLFDDPLLGQTLWNTAYYAVGTIPVGVALALGLALLLNHQRRGVALLRTIFFLPIVTSGVALTLLWGWIFNARYGLLNQGLALVGLHGPAWLQDEGWAMPALILMNLWLVGVNMVIYLAALQDLPGELIDAATMDGASGGQRFRWVLWPLLSPVTFYLLVVNGIGTLQVFTPTYILTRGGPNNATLTLPLYLYFQAFLWGDLGYAALLGWLIFVLTLLLTWGQFHLARRWVFYRGGMV